MDQGADHVIGSRYIAGGAIPKEWGIHRKFLSFFGSLFARIVWLKPYVHDMTSGFKLTKTDYLKRVDLDNLLSGYYAYKLHILHDILTMKPKVKEVLK
jgi:dolichol-phosphate mannosyltransferase